MARPRATRCRWPPESSAGFRCSNSCSPRSSATRLILRLRSAEGRRRTLSRKRCFPRRSDGKQRVGLEDHGDVAFGRRQLGHIPAANTDGAPESISRPAMRRRMVDLPHPEGPSITSSSLASAVQLTRSTALTSPQAFEMSSSSICLRCSLNGYGFPGGTKVGFQRPFLLDNPCLVCISLVS